MSTFPDTPVTLLMKLAAQVAGEDEQNWERFAELYVPAIHEFVRNRCDGRDVDDIVQEVLVNLVSVLRSNRFQPRPGAGHFRAYLARMIRNQLYMLYRKEKARGMGRFCSLDEVNLVIPEESVIAQLDIEWKVACRRAAVEHVLTKTMVSDLNKNLYRAFVLEGRTIDDVVKAFGVTKNQVSQAKVRIGRMIAAVEAEYGD